MPEIGVVLVDDHPIVLSGLMQLLDREPGIAVLAACTRAAEVLAVVASCRPEVLLLDASLPDRSGVEVLPDIAAVSPGTRTVIFAERIEEERVAAALNEGATAVVFKDSSVSELVACIRRVAAGGEWIMAGAAGARGGVAEQRRPLDVAALLSPREREIAERVARGARNKEIAWELGLAEGTVKLHISNAFKKLGVGNRVGLAQMIASSPTSYGSEFIKATRDGATRLSAAKLGLKSGLQPSPAGAPGCARAGGGPGDIAESALRLGQRGLQNP